MDEGHHARDGARRDTERVAVDIGRERPGSGLDGAGDPGFIRERPGELLVDGRRRAQGQGKDAMDLFDHRGLGALQGPDLQAWSPSQFSKLQRVLAELGEDDAVDDAARLGIEAVGVEGLPQRRRLALI